MWSLPDIKRLNAEAVAQYEAKKKKTELELCEGQDCEFYCSGNKAEYAFEYYDVFGDRDIPKGHVLMCEECYQNYGSVPEGYFWCESCEKLHISNYTWELYHTHIDDYGLVCLNCALDIFLEDESNWLTSAEEITPSKLLESQHLIPVGGQYWKEHLTFVGNEEFDSMTGATLSGSSSTVDQSVGLRNMREIAESALETSDKYCLILDAGYQFSVSIGIYIPKEVNNG